MRFKERFWRLHGHTDLRRRRFAKRHGQNEENSEVLVNLLMVSSRLAFPSVARTPSSAESARDLSQSWCSVFVVIAFQSTLKQPRIITGASVSSYVRKLFLNHIIRNL